MAETRSVREHLEATVHTLLAKIDDEAGRSANPDRIHQLASAVSMLGNATCSNWPSDSRPSGLAVKGE